jgi:Predicted oxidoreductases (related to aryl-alcohol dehydrogenases)
MAAFPDRVALGRSGFSVCPLGVAGGYGVDERSLLKALDRGVNYWYHGSLRRPGMKGALRSLSKQGRRDEVVLVVQSYSRLGLAMELSLKAALRGLKTDRADVLLLGLYNDEPPEALLDRATRLKEAGLVRQIALSGHRRSAFVDYAKDERYGLFHVRYSAAHPGAETELFPHLGAERRPGFVAYTATSWGQLLDGRNMPEGELPLRARDCYRFVLSNPDINVCMTGPSDASQLDEALAALDEGPLLPEEEERIRRIGRHVWEIAPKA